jgi:hypothetical protein
LLQLALFALSATMPAQAQVVAPEQEHHYVVFQENGEVKQAESVRESVMERTASHTKAVQQQVAKRIAARPRTVLKNTVMGSMLGIGLGCAVAAVAAVTGGVAIAVVATCGVVAGAVSGVLSHPTKAIEKAAALVMAAVETHRHVREMGDECLQSEEESVRLWWCEEAGKELEHLEKEADNIEWDGNQGCCAWCGCCCHYEVPTELREDVREKLQRLIEKVKAEGPISHNDWDLVQYNDAGETLENYLHKVATSALLCEQVKKQFATACWVLLGGAIVVLVVLALKHYYW